MSENLTLKFDPNTIEHLGISLYSKLPSVLSELVSNSWDADADNVRINFYDKDGAKEIIYEDDGTGMSFDELNYKFLLIGRNRRRETKDSKTAKDRFVIGKKGLGKLSVFGVCDIIEVKSIQNGILNHFRMCLNDIKTATTGMYNPELLKDKNTPTTESNGTTLYLKSIRRKSGFNLGDIAISLSKKFMIFDALQLKMFLNDAGETDVTNELKFNSFEEQFRWDFPNSLDESYKYKDNVRGFILTTVTPIKDTEMSGIYLVSRGKIVNTASFYGLRDNDQFHSYVTGYLDVDFIDDFNEDVISTDRHSLNWENDQTKELQFFLQNVIKKIGNEWKRKRSEVKKEDIKKTTLLDIAEWQKKLPRFEKDLSDKIIEPILSNPRIETEKSSEIIKNVIDKFENRTFKEYAEKIAEISNEEQLPQFLTLISDWKAIEAKQFRDIAVSRVEVIKQFEEYLDNDTKEVPTLHNFLKKFSWLLDPRILEFRDEVTYSKLLSETFPDEVLNIQDRRIDFLCSNALGEILYVIEIKRSSYKIDEKAIEQAYKYGVFLKKKYAQHVGFSKVVCYVVGGSKSGDDFFESKEDTYRKSGEVFVKTYRELLEQSKEYHKEFIQTYNEYNNR
ncbi:ATP-binding protein [Sediminibacterium ginsengisoli]|uniref:Histidine kinase-, DNA gyrase B-, and HSP90-like ATPase n=1 Tax=Sediminibacterium ginsengisoli TaxID=413434 RepID=A0A1T4RXM0_9BACT|nr:ATP-binding protein [Sediminibacterium ginsengisoli]SKA20740.1 Histidine kinase-, DNA gyrase B-, and HSP90-like ATPase [Sediminibacterium ginsengisoli]